MTLPDSSVWNGVCSGEHGDLTARAQSGLSYQVLLFFLIGDQEWEEDTDDQRKIKQILKRKKIQEKQKFRKSTRNRSKQYSVA